MGSTLIRHHAAHYSIFSTAAIAFFSSSIPTHYRAISPSAHDLYEN
jgi:hypothetical protein